MGALGSTRACAAAGDAASATSTADSEVGARREAIDRCVSCMVTDEIGGDAEGRRVDGVRGPDGDGPAPDLPA